jgi:hypothetical protein
MLDQSGLIFFPYLSSVEALSPHDASCRQLEVRVLAEDDGRLAAEFQGAGGQVFRGGLGHHFAHHVRTRKEDVVPLKKKTQQTSNTCNSNDSVSATKSKKPQFLQKKKER